MQIFYKNKWLRSHSLKSEEQNLVQEWQVVLNDWRHQGESFQIDPKMVSAWETC